MQCNAIQTYTRWMEGGGEGRKIGRTVGAELREPSEESCSCEMDDEDCILLFRMCCGDSLLYRAFCALCRSG